MNVIVLQHAMASLLYQLDHGIAGNASHKNAVLEWYGELFFALENPYLSIYSLVTD